MVEADEAWIAGATAAREIAERYCDAWVGDDLFGVIDCYADDFVLHYGGSNPYSGDHLGRDAALGVLAEVSTVAPRVLVAIEEVTVAPGAAVVVARERLSRGTDAHEVRRILRCRIEGDRFAECWLLEEDQSLVDHLWREA